MKNLREKIDQYLWALMWVLPVFVFFVSWFRVGNAPDFFQFVNNQFAFDFVADIINDVWNLAFGSDFVIAGYLSYLVAVQIGHCFFDVVVFIPRFAHDLVNKCFDFCGGK